jgi:hypothetical protein
MPAEAVLSWKAEGEAMKTTQDRTQFDVKLSLPAAIAQEAVAGGLLEPNSLATLVTEELRRRKVDHLFQAADRLAQCPVPPLSESEVEAEVGAVRTRGRSAHASGG